MKIADRMRLKQIKALVRLYEKRGRVSTQTAERVRSITPDTPSSVIQEIMDDVRNDLYGSSPCETGSDNEEGKEVKNDDSLD